MAWNVDFHSQFVPDFKALDEEVQDELLALVEALKVFGPQMGRTAWTRWSGRGSQT